MILHLSRRTNIRVFFNRRSTGWQDSSWRRIMSSWRTNMTEVSIASNADGILDYRGLIWLRTTFVVSIATNQTGKFSLADNSSLLGDARCAVCPGRRITGTADHFTGTRSGLTVSLSRATAGRKNVSGWLVHQNRRTNREIESPD